jgi:hypothetical protein
LVWRPERKRPLGRLKRRWEDNIKLDFQEIEWWGGMEWIRLAQDKDRRQPLVNPIMELGGS